MCKFMQHPAIMHPAGAIATRGGPRVPKEPLNYTPGQELEVTVDSSKPFGVMVKVSDSLTCLLHKSQLSSVEKELDPMKDFTPGQSLKVILYSARGRDQPR